MPTLTSAQYILTLTYTTTAPIAGSVYKDTSNSQYYFMQVVGSGTTAQYFISTDSTPPVLGVLTKLSGTGDSTVTLTNVALQPVYCMGPSRLEAGQSITTQQYFPTLPNGVVQISATPSYNPALYSSLITSTGSYTLASTITDNYRITFYVSTGSTGSIAIQPNGLGNAITLVGGQEYQITCLTRIINSLTYTVTSTVAVSLLIEQI